MKTITLENGNKVEISDESYNAIANAAETILVPECIKIENCGKCDSLGIVFNDNKQVLFIPYSVGASSYAVLTSTEKRFIQCKLISVKKEERLIGHTYYASEAQNPDFDCRNFYYKYLGDDECVNVFDKKSVHVSKRSSTNLWKVVPVEDE